MLGFIKPRVRGELVPFPKNTSRLLKDDGEQVDLADAYWQGALVDGSVVEIAAPADQSSFAPASSAGPTAPSSKS